MPAVATAVDFSKLKCLTQAELHLWQALYRFGATLDWSQGFFPRLMSSLSEVLRCPSSVRFKGMRLEAALPWQQRLSQAGVFATLSAGPSGEKAYLLVDPVFALSLIDRLLGGEPTELPSARRLTEIEAGAMSYLIARALQSFFDFLGSEQGHYRLEKIYGLSEELGPLLANVATLALIDLQVSLPEVGAHVQLCLPDRFIQQELGGAIDSGAFQARLSEERSRRLQSFGDLPLHYLVMVGAAVLSNEECQSLHIGDIVLLDSHQVGVSAGGLTGELSLVPSQGRGPRVQLAIEDPAPPAKLRVKEIYHG